MRISIVSSLLLSLFGPPAFAAPAPLGGVAVVGLPRGVTTRPAGADELERLRAARGGGSLLFAGVIAGRGIHVRYEFFRSGHVGAPMPGTLDPEVQLRALVATVEGSAAWRPTAWRVPPQWSERAAQLRWAYDVRSAQTEALRTLGFSAQLTREGVLLFSHTSLDARDFAAADARFRELVAAVHILPARGWLDLRQGDARAAFAAPDLIATRGAPATDGGELTQAPLAPATARDWREWIERTDWRALAQKVNWVQLVFAFLVLKALWGFLRRRIVDPEEIRLPSEAGKVGSAKPIHPDEPKNRPLG